MNSVGCEADSSNYFDDQKTSPLNINLDRNNYNSSLTQARSYKKYLLKNVPKDKIRPFYVWKEGFMENYKKITPAQKPTYSGIDALNDEYE